MKAVGLIAFSNHVEFICGSRATCFQTVSTVMQQKLVVQVVAWQPNGAAGFFFFRK